jgi:hypothetical protein
MTKYKDKDSGLTLMSFNVKWVSWAHTGVAYSQFVPPVPRASIQYYFVKRRTRIAWLTTTASLYS